MARESGLRGDVARLTRGQLVWLSLLVSMTGVGGLLAVLDGRPALRIDGMALVAPSRSSSGGTIETIYQTRAALEPARWKGIVIHHSGSGYGSAKTLAEAHTERGLRGLGYHFVIGNGAGSGDGELFVSHRWLDQLPGAHAAGPRGEWHNLNTIGICLIGDGDRRAFSEAQLRRLTELVASLCRELGLDEQSVSLHRDIAATTSPGAMFPEATLREGLASLR